MAHSIFRSDNLAATGASAGLYSVKYNDGTANADIDNGHVVALDSLISGEREVWKAVTPAADTALSKIVIVGSPELMYDERLRNLTDFYNEADVAARGYMLTAGDIFTVSVDAVTATTPAVGNIVELQADTKLKIVASLTSGSTAVGKVIALEKIGTTDCLVIRVG
ncbi:hypothetical protein SDC9_41236 [bioreactor metagenome]|uniref:Uncharacterized protein n=1 Tax=bioreactor metagenome TaxID=1076179 RepID=A0A644VXM7_9ZZZZ